MINLIKTKKKGSTLVLVLMFMSVLMILGTAITSLALSNYKMRNIHGEITRRQYEAESGLDQAYFIINEIVDETKYLDNETQIKQSIRNNLGGISDKIDSSQNALQYDNLFNGNLKVEVKKVTNFDAANTLIITIKSSSTSRGIEKIVSADYHIVYKSNSEINIQMKNWNMQK